MRGLYSAGIMDVFLENNVEFDGAIGVSAGAAFGCNYKSKQAGRVIRYSKRFAKDPRYCSFASLLLTGDLYNGDFCYHTMPEKYDSFDVETYRNNPMEFWVVVTDIDKGEAEYKRLDDGGYEDIEWMRASASLPIAARPVEMDGKRYLDGGVVDSIPLPFFESEGYEKNVVIMTQPKGFRKPVQKALGLTKLIMHDSPNVFAHLENRHNEYDAQTDYVMQREEDGAVLAIYPDEDLAAGKFTHDPEEMQRIYDIGRATGEKYLPQVQAFLSE